MNDLRFERIALEQEREVGYDLVLVALGYESRAIAVSTELLSFKDRIVAIGFDHNREAAYAANTSWYSSNGIRLLNDISDGDFPQIIAKELEELASQRGSSLEPSRVACDVSCLNRFRIASILAAAIPLTQQGKITLDIWYALAEFQPPEGGFVQNEIVGPVHSRFAGWFRDPGRPIALVAGLGYEPGKVMGATEYLQASKVVAFMPVSLIKDYEPDLRQANESLLAELGERDVIEYAVEDPVGTLAILDSAIRGLEEEHNVVILPLGPKMFSVLALLAQLFHADSSVWRVSSGRHGLPRDVRSSGYFYGIGVRPETIAVGVAKQL
ncbi:hypothetical protein B9N43_10510 [Denitratisoma sp. DHT3]|uniref:hypothetical protein n=1 Tax=Denitratisoma sp. DHT3 TaxID=1981880 RepID=UPI001198B45C|nr:hypothetical protein [Denitratisoma sp. DHT3]QDX81646.1 hypothetical protein B9N43_10510 [Denitratisoma sp. DHT3]